MATLTKDERAARNRLVLRLAMVAVAIFIGVKLFGGPPHETPRPSQATSSDPYGDTAKQAAWMAIGKDAVRAKLKDPDSATFRNVRFHKAILEGKPTPVTCGEVNSKNGFGGFSGFQRFISGGGAATTFLEEEVEDFANAWTMMCG